MNSTNWAHTPLCTFDLVRTTDHNGNTGTGTVARGVQFPDGTVVMQWIPPRSSIAIWPNIDLLIEIHGHNGDTTVHWH